MSHIDSAKVHWTDYSARESCRTHRLCATLGVLSLGLLRRNVSNLSTYFQDFRESFGSLFGKKPSKFHAKSPSPSTVQSSALAIPVLTASKWRVFAQCGNHQYYFKSTENLEKRGYESTWACSLFSRAEIPFGSISKTTGCALIL